MRGLGWRDPRSLRRTVSGRRSRSARRRSRLRETTRVIWHDGLNGAPLVDSAWAGAEPAEFERVFLALALHGTFGAGTCRVQAERYDSAGPRPLPARFTVTEDHRRLLQLAWWRPWGIDPKYPFGTREDYPVDMALGLGRAVGPDYRISEVLRSEMEGLYRDLWIVVGLWLDAVALTPGRHQLPWRGVRANWGLRQTPPPAAEVADYLAKVARIEAAGYAGDPVVDRLNAEGRLFGKI